MKISHIMAMQMRGTCLELMATILLQVPATMSRFRERDICHLSACDSGGDSVKESRRGGDFKKKFMSIQVNESRINVAMVF